MNKRNIYLDNGATTKVDEEVVKEMNKYFLEDYGNASSLHSFGQTARESIEEARKKFAKKINADSDEIIFTSGGSESDNLAIKGYVMNNKAKGNHMITSKIEHPAIKNTCEFLEKKHGFKITYLNVNKEGFVDLKQLQDSITDDTLIVSIMHANNEIGVIQPLKKISDIIKNKNPNTIFHTDAVQSFTKVNIDVQKDGIDMASFSSHKIHGPKGVGALFVKKGTKISKLIDGGSHEFDKRGGTENVPGIMGFIKAVELVNIDDLKKIENLSKRLKNGLLDITKDSWLNGPEIGVNRIPNNVNISYKYIEGESLLLYLDEEGICVSTGSACSSHSLEPSHVLMALGLKPEEAHGSLRFTLSKYTKEEDIDYVIKKMKIIVGRLRDMSPLVK